MVNTRCASRWMPLQPGRAKWRKRRRGFSTALMCSAFLSPCQRPDTLPVCHRAIAPLEMRSLPIFETLLCNQLLIHFDPKSHSVRHWIVGAVQPRLDREAFRIVKTEMGFRRAVAGFEPGEIRSGWYAGTASASPINGSTDSNKPSTWRSRRPNTRPSVKAVSIARSE